MIIKSAVVILRVVDMLWDGYDVIASRLKKIGIKRNENQIVSNMTEPTYSVVNK